MKKGPHYPLAEVRRKLADGDYRINGNALDHAYSDFSWGPDDIVKAMLKLRLVDFYKTDDCINLPGVKLDFYRAQNLNGESVFTHFYISGHGRLIINSFKKL